MVAPNSLETKVTRLAILKTQATKRFTFRSLLADFNALELCQFDQQIELTLLALMGLLKDGLIHEIGVTEHDVVEYVISMKTPSCRLYATPSERLQSALKIWGL